MYTASLLDFVNKKNNEKPESYEIYFDFPMSDCCSFKVGGKAEVVIYPHSVAAFKEILAYVNDYGIPFRVIGNGTNLIPSDNGFAGVLIITKKICEMCFDGDEVKASCGVSLSKMALLASDLSLSGLENLYGIPATVGGAIYMNAGAFGSQVSDVLVSAELYDVDSSCFATLTKEEMDFSYRHSICKEKGFIVLSATFLLVGGDEAEIKNAMKASMEKRKATQPLEFPNAGSIFKRPENNYAGKLIQDAGLKGFCVGGACVSEKHAGFIVNTGKATSKDIYELIDIIKAKVYELSGVMLECEVEKL